MRFLITGGAGFIGSALTRLLIQDTLHEVLVLDALTYAGSLSTLTEVRDNGRLRFVRGDIRDGALVARLLEEYRPDAIFHLAAESHVDRSVDEPGAFLATNVEGTFVMLGAAARYHATLAGPKKARFRFMHISTDEVFGSLGATGEFREDTRYDPRSPYSASKAASDHLVAAWHHTYGLPTITTNCSNNFGPYQFPEKLIPLMIARAVAGEPLPVYGSGQNVRDWIHVEDHARGLLAAWEHGVPGESYLFGGRAERTNIEIVQAICSALDLRAPRPDGRPHGDAITHVADRPGHDARYAVDCSRAERELGWTRNGSFEDALAETIDWYLANDAWVRAVDRSGAATQRRGLRGMAGGRS